MYVCLLALSRATALEQEPESACDYLYAHRGPLVLGQANASTLHNVSSSNVCSLHCNPDTKSHVPPSMLLLCAYAAFIQMTDSHGRSQLAGCLLL